MSSNKKPLPAKINKKKDKETKRVTGALTPQDVAPTYNWKILAKFPPLKPKKTKQTAEVKGAMKRMETKKKKLHSKHAKRTTPGTIEEDIIPYAHAQRHPETKKTLQNIEKQTLSKGRRISNKVKNTKK